MSARRARAISAILAALVAGCGEAPPPSACPIEGGVVTRVKDGDTVEIDHGGGTRDVRYLLVDTPELLGSECFAAEARELNRRLVLDRHVTLTYDQDLCIDPGQRLLAYVWVEGAMVNRILIERGHGRLLVVRGDAHPGPYEYEAEFEALEAEAREAGRGLWGVCP